MVAILMMSTKLVTLGFLKINMFWKKGYDAIISVHDVTNKILWHDSNCIVDVDIWPKFGDSSISVSFHNLNFIRIWPEKHVFEGCSWFKLNDVRLSLGMTSKFGTSVLPGLKLNVRKCWVLIPIIVEVTGETGRGAFPLILSRVKAYSCILRH